MSSLNLQNVEDEEEQLRRPKNNNREYIERFQWLKSALDFFYTHKYEHKNKWQTHYVFTEFAQSTWPPLPLPHIRRIAQYRGKTQAIESQVKVWFTAPVSRTSHCVWRRQRAFERQIPLAACKACKAMFWPIPGSKDNSSSRILTSCQQYRVT